MCFTCQWVALFGAFSRCTTSSMGARALVLTVYAGYDVQVLLALYAATKMHTA